MSPRRSAADAAAPRSTIVGHPVDVASVDGLDGLTIGRLAGDLRMSKAGVNRHFGTKQALQLAARDQAIAIFTREVWDRAAATPPGTARFASIADSWIIHRER